jgi:hypothetical protein
MDVNTTDMRKKQRIRKMLAYTLPVLFELPPQTEILGAVYSRGGNEPLMMVA